MLTISANREWDHNEDDEVFAAERPHGTYTRRVLLGDSLDSSNLPSVLRAWRADRDASRLRASTAAQDRDRLGERSSPDRGLDRN